MRVSIFAALILGMVSVNATGTTPNKEAALRGRPSLLAYQRLLPDGRTPLRIYNFTDSRKGFVLFSGDDIIGYSTEGAFDENTAAPALLAMLESMSASAPESSTGTWGEVAPLRNERGYVMWNQDSPFNDLCPEYEMGKRAPSGCVATAMAQVMYYHQWPKRGTGSHTYSPAVMVGNTLTADFGETEYNWEAMLPYYEASDMTADDESRRAVAELLLHCGVSVEMVYYTQSGATDYDVPPALVNYFGYDQSLAYRKREHYSSSDWLRIIHDELEEGRPVLAYGKSASGGHAFVFDGMDADGFIHVNWGWGGMSNGYFNTSVLTPPVQGIGGADGGFNYSQRIITGIRPATAIHGDWHVELTSTEALSVNRKKIAQGDDVKIKLAGKVMNHGWRDAEFDYALLLTDLEGQMVKVIEGPKGYRLEMNASDYAPDFGEIALGPLPEGEYLLAPAVRASGATGEWIPVRDEYVGYPNILRVSASESEISFASCDYFDLKASEVMVPETIWSGCPTLITAEIENVGDVEYHGEIRAALFSGKTETATTSNYIIDLRPGETASMRFTDSFDVAEGDYTLALVNDDGQKICSPVAVTVKTPSHLGNVTSVAKPTMVEASCGNVAVKAVVSSDDMFQGLLYAFIYDNSGRLQQGCLYPEYISLEGDSPIEVTLEGEFENGTPGSEYLIQLAVYAQNRFTFLEDENSSMTFILDGGSGVQEIENQMPVRYKYYDFNGFEVDPRHTKLYKKVKLKSTI